MKSKQKSGTSATAKKSKAVRPTKSAKKSSGKNPSAKNKKPAAASTKGSANKNVKAAAKKSKARTASASKNKKNSKKKKGDTLMCFLSTACVRYFRLPDHCEELNTLRNYRDTYLASTEEGRQLISTYYKISPGLVKKIEGDLNKKTVYSYIYNCILQACREINEAKWKAAESTYKNMVLRLQEQFQVA